MAERDETSLTVGPQVGDRTIGKVREPHVDLTHDELEERLRQKRLNIQARVDALQDEVLTTGDSLKQAVVRSPFALVGGAVVAGLLVGLLVGGRSRRKRRMKATSAHEALVRGYVEAVVKEVRTAVAAGDDLEKAVRSALGDRVPLIVVASGREESSSGKPGFMRSAFSSMLHSGLTMALPLVTELIAARIGFVQGREEATEQQAASQDAGLH